MRKQVLAICLLALAVPFAAAQNVGSSNGRTITPRKPHGHAPEMSTNAMVVAGVIALGGYFFIRRRLAAQN